MTKSSTLIDDQTENSWDRNLCFVNILSSVFLYWFFLLNKVILFTNWNHFFKLLFQDKTLFIKTKLLKKSIFVTSTKLVFSLSSPFYITSQFLNMFLQIFVFFYYIVYTDYWDKNQFKENLQLLWKIFNTVFKNNKKLLLQD